MAQYKNRSSVYAERERRAHVDNLVCVWSRWVLRIWLFSPPYGVRRIARFAGGSFDGPKLRGTVLPGGADGCFSGVTECSI
ncbi:DUF3237 family protein [Bradyrhizobium jicamae]|nr:DUF3237 family protein [Bradyrhizobium jicamae]